MVDFISWFHLHYRYEGKKNAKIKTITSTSGRVTITKFTINDKKILFMLKYFELFYPMFNIMQNE